MCKQAYKQQHNNTTPCMHDIDPYTLFKAARVFCQPFCHVATTMSGTYIMPAASSEEN